MSMPRMRRVFNFSLIFLAGTILKSSKQALLDHTDPPGLGINGEELDLSDLNRGWNNLLQAVGPSVDQLSPARMLSQSNEHQIAARPHQLSPFRTHRPSSSSSRADGYHAPYRYLANLDHPSGASERFANPLSHQDIYHSDVAAHIAVATAARPQSLYATSGSYHEAACLSPRSQIVEGGVGSTQASRTSLIDSRSGDAKGQIQTSFNSFEKQLRVELAEAPLSPDNYLQSPSSSSKKIHGHLPPEAPSPKKIRSLSNEVNSCGENFPQNPICKSYQHLEYQECQHESKQTMQGASKSTGLRIQLFHGIELLDPDKHGYLDSLKSFIRLSRSLTIQSGSNLKSDFWVKETDAKKLIKDWELAKLPYPPPFEMETIRRAHVQRHFISIATEDIKNSDISEKLNQMAEFLKESIQKIPSVHRSTLYILSKNKRNFPVGLGIKIVNSTCAAILLAKMINSIFPPNNLLREQKEEQNELWEFLKTFWTELSYFQPDLQQKYSWLKNSTPDSKNIIQQLRSVKANIVRDNDLQDTFHLSGLLVEAWLGEERPTLHAAITEKGGKLNRKFVSLIYQYITYIRPFRSPEPRTRIQFLNPKKRNQKICLE